MLWTSVQLPLPQLLAPSEDMGGLCWLWCCRSAVMAQSRQLTARSRALITLVTLAQRGVVGRMLGEGRSRLLHLLARGMAMFVWQSLDCSA